MGEAADRTGAPFYSDSSRDGSNKPDNVALESTRTWSEVGSPHVDVERKRKL
jgi:hypothetical protein